MTEWAECRTTIGRMDTVLEDLRKYGFALVTGLLTAGGLVGTATTSTTAASVVPAAALVVMVLVLGLFGVDMYYQVLLSAAVERALDLEQYTDPPVRLTWYVSRNASRTRATYAVLVVYYVFLAAAAAQAWFVKDAKNGAVVIIAVVIAMIMLGYFGVAVNAGKLRTKKARPGLVDR